MNTDGRPANTLCELTSVISYILQKKKDQQVVIFPYKFTTKTG